MRVKPEVSSGLINPDTLLPEEETTEVETDVLLADGQGVVIGGLIQQKDVETQSKVPGVGDWHVVGRLFQNRRVEKRRNEIVVTLLPRIINYPSIQTPREAYAAKRSMTPLLYGPLCRYPRPWDPMLPDAINNPRKCGMCPNWERDRRCPNSCERNGCQCCRPYDPMYPPYETGTPILPGGEHIILPHDEAVEVIPDIVFPSSSSRASLPRPEIRAAVTPALAVTEDLEVSGASTALVNAEKLLEPPKRRKKSHSESKPEKKSKKPNESKKPIKAKKSTRSTHRRLRQSARPSRLPENPFRR